MSFFAILLALLLEQARPLRPNSLPQQLSRAWIQQSLRSFDLGPQANAWLGWGLLALLPTLLLALLHHLLRWADNWLAWVLLLALHSLVLYFTLGFRQFSAHFSRIRSALDAEQLPPAQQEWAQWAGQTSVQSRHLGRQELIEHSLGLASYSAHLHVFGPMTAYLMGLMLGLGPGGVLLYRLAEQCKRLCLEQAQGSGPAPHAPPISPAMQAAAQQAWHAIDWLPARITVLLFAIAGNFEEALAHWRKQSQSSHGAPAHDDHSALVLATAAGALGLRMRLARSGTASHQALGQTEEGEEDGTAELRPPQLEHFHTLIGLTWRSLVICMTILAFSHATSMGHL